MEKMYLPKRIREEMRLHGAEYDAVTSLYNMTRKEIESEISELKCWQALAPYYRLAMIDVCHFINQTNYATNKPAFLLIEEPDDPNDTGGLMIVEKK